MFPNNPIDVKTINGIVITHSKLIIAVSDIERATSPFAKEVSMLDVTPPGAAAIIITPIANSGCNWPYFHKNKCNNRKYNNLRKKLLQKNHEVVLQLLKNRLQLIPALKPSIIKANAKGKNISVTIFITAIIIRVL